MNINQTTGPGQPSPATTGSTLQKKKKPLSSDFETFLKMLTAQMQNQDPLKPIESADFASQLATFSAVEQQVRTNKLLEGLGEKLGVGSLSQLAGWVGMEARAPIPAKFDGLPLIILPHPAEQADRAVLVIQDSAGTEVQHIPISTSGESIQWAGVDDHGNPFPPGLYSFNVESYKDGKLLGTSIAETYAKVREVSQLDGKTVLVLEGGKRVLPKEVTALRQAG